MDSQQADQGGDARQVEPSAPNAPNALQINCSSRLQSVILVWLDSINDSDSPSSSEASSVVRGVKRRRCGDYKMPEIEPVSTPTPTSGPIRESGSIGPNPFKLLKTTDLEALAEYPISVIPHENLDNIPEDVKQLQRDLYRISRGDFPMIPQNLEV